MLWDVVPSPKTQQPAGEMVEEGVGRTEAGAWKRDAPVRWVGGGGAGASRELAPGTENLTTWGKLFLEALRFQLRHLPAL